MKKYTIIALILILSNSMFAQKISENTEVSVLTCSPGPELYTAFGHSAIRFQDLDGRLDYVFNYGSFNFSTPNFYLKFVRGELNYMLAVEGYEGFEREYSRDNRDVYAQILDLTYEQKQSLLNYLFWKSKDENKYYLYDFFFDNCATRVRDVLKHQLGDSIIFQERDYNKTLRQMLNPYLEGRDWLHFGINTVIGLPSDQNADSQLAMYLPDNVDTVFANSYLISDKGKIPLVKERRHIIKSIKKHEKKSFFNKNFTPKNVFWLFFIGTLLFTIYEFFKKKKNYILDFIITITFGLIGLLVVLTWFGTIHGAADKNLNILWALPTHLVFAFFIIKKNKPKFLKNYFLVITIYNLIFLSAWVFLPQEIDLAVLPLFLILTVRYFSAFLYMRNATK